MAAKQNGANLHASAMMANVEVSTEQRYDSFYRARSRASSAILSLINLILNYFPQSMHSYVLFF